jgi:NIMA (never in mitosis gene a)-related kinase
MSGHIEDYEVLNVIGTGSFGTCYKVKNKSSGHLYVWKAIGYGGMSEEKKQVCVSNGLLKKNNVYDLINQLYCSWHMIKNFQLVLPNHF